MKKQPWSREEVPYVRVEPFPVRLKKSATEHGFKGCVMFLLSKIRDLINFYLHLMAQFAPHNGIRVLIYRVRGVTIGKNVIIGPNVSIDNFYPKLVTISDGAVLSGSNLILAHSSPPEHFKGVVESFVAPVTVQKNAWIGMAAIILPGVTIGEGSIVSAASLVTRNVPPNCLVAGNPARRIKVLKADESSV